MNIIMSGQVIGLADKDAVTRIQELNRLFKNLLDKNEIVQEVVIDGVVYQEGYNQLLLQNVQTIQEVEIRTINGAALSADIRVNLQEYLPKLIGAFDSISEIFYGQMRDDDWSYFAQLVEGMQWVVQSVQVLVDQAVRFSSSPLLGVLTVFIAQSEEQLGQLEGYMQKKDYTAAGDLIKYELPNIYQSLFQSLSEEQA